MRDTQHRMTPKSFPDPEYDIRGDSGSANREPRTTNREPRTCDLCLPGVYGLSLSHLRIARYDQDMAKRVKARPHAIECVFRDLLLSRSPAWWHNPKRSDL
jgi:hypothetical protein